MELNLIEKMPGTFITPTPEGQSVWFGDEKIDLVSLQRDHFRRVRVTMDRDGKLALDPAEDYWLLAEIDIPAAVYADRTTGETDLEGNPVYERVREPIGAVEVTLWPLP